MVQTGAGVQRRCASGLAPASARFARFGFHVHAERALCRAARIFFCVRRSDGWRALCPSAGPAGPREVQRAGRVMFALLRSDRRRLVARGQLHPCAAIASKQTRRLSRCPRREGRARHRRTRFSPSPVGCMLGPCRAAAPSSQGLARAAATFAQASAARARGGARGPIQAMRRRAHGVKQFARPVLELGVA